MPRSMMLMSVSAMLATLGFAQDFPNRDRSYRQDYPEVIPVGTLIRARTDQTIDVRDRSDGRVYPATVAEDVMGPDGRVVIPRGERAELIVHNLSDNEMVVDLES